MFSTFTNQVKESTEELVFIDVSADGKPNLPDVVKEERSSSPDEKLADVKSSTKAGKERLQCSECSRVCYSAEHMLRHMRVHRGENPFQCAMCRYSTYNRTLFQEHVNTHMGIKPYQCTHCDYRSVSKKYIKKHESRHGTCDKCGFIARDIRKLRRHRQLNLCGAGPDIKQGEFTCSNCNLFYSTRECLLQHKKLHKICPQCNEEYCTTVMYKHMEEKHGVKKPVCKKNYKFKCSECAYKSNTHSKILLHLIHHPQKVDESIDITPLVKTGILTRDSPKKQKLNRRTPTKSL